MFWNLAFQHHSYLGSGVKKVMVASKGKKKEKAAIMITIASAGRILHHRLIKLPIFPGGDRLPFCLTAPLSCPGHLYLQAARAGRQPLTVGCTGGMHSFSCQLSCSSWAISCALGEMGKCNILAKVTNSSSWILKESCVR